jgi:hypothetical protein
MVGGTVTAGTWVGTGAFVATEAGAWVTGAGVGGVGAQAARIRAPAEPAAILMNSRREMLRLELLDIP